MRVSSDPQPQALTPVRIALIVAGLAIMSALSYYRLIKEKEEELGRPMSISGETMGTTYAIKVLVPPKTAFSIWEFQLQSQTLMGLVEIRMSTYLPHSTLSKFNAWDSSEPFEISQEIATVLAAALKVSDQSAGAFDITVGPIVNAYGFGPKKPETPPTPSELAALKERVGYEKLTLDLEASTLQKSRPDIYCDLSAVAKGYAVDLIARMLEREGISDYFIEIGGEIRASGRNARGETWTVGIEEPLPDRRNIYKVLPLHNYAMATSGDYRNYYEENGKRISHTIDGRTGRPIDHDLASVTVFHDECMMADAYATALMVLGPDDGYLMAELLELPALFLTRNEDATFKERVTPAYIDRFGSAR